MVLYIGVISGAVTGILVLFGVSFASSKLIEFQEFWIDGAGTEAFWLYLFIAAVVGGIPGGILGTIAGIGADSLKRDYRPYSALGGVIGGLIGCLIFWWQVWQVSVPS
jgi:hypothetical protein